MMQVIRGRPDGRRGDQERPAGAPAGGGLRPPPRVSAACLLLGAAGFAVAWTLAVVAAGDLASFFYEPRVLAVAHTFTLGWISLTMIGVLYQYVPALTKRPILWPRAAGLQVTLFVLGTIGLVTHFWTGTLLGVEYSAALAGAGVALLAAQLLPPLLRAPRYDATVTGLIGALIFLVCTAGLGVLYAVDKVHPFLPGSVLSNVAAHAHLGVLGWVTLTICAISYRMVAAFLLPEIPLPAAARRQIVLLIIAVPLLVAAIFLRSRLAAPAAAAVVVAMVWYAAILARLARTRRMPIDWTLRHVIAALVHLAAAAVAALALFAVDPAGELGSRLVLVYGLFLLVGWISNYIVGMGTRMAPGLMGLGAAPVLPERHRAVVFWLLNGGVAAIAASLLLGNVAALRAALVLPLAAAALFAAGFIQRLRARKKSLAACRS